MDCSGQNKIIKDDRSPRPRCTRPFKISDIHKLHATIPSNILKDHNQVFDENSKQFTVEYNNPEVHDLQLTNLYQPLQNAEINQVENTDSKDEYISDPDIDPFILPEVDLEPSEDFKLDQSMFDPKTLLKCVVNDNYCDELIPPPPEFCSEDIVSPGCSTSNLTLADSYESVKEPMFGLNETVKNIDNPDTVNLTPRSIETWNLSRDENWECYDSLNLSPAKSSSVTRRNTLNINSRSNIISRRDRLGKFMFNKKVKLKRK